MLTFLEVVYYICNVLTIIILLRVIVSWYTGPTNALFIFFDWITRPILSPLRRFLTWVTKPIVTPLHRTIPWLGRIDFTPAVAIVLIWLLYYLLGYLLI
ncbi:YggT family protein [Chloroflexota bacterium]